MTADIMAPFLAASAPDIWFVGDLDGEVIGFGFCEPERMTEGTWNLLAIGVSPEQQGMGHGAKLMAFLEDVLRRRKARILLVETSGTDAFKLTRQFYLKNGYVQEARIRAFYDAGDDKIVFWKQL